MTGHNMHVSGHCYNLLLRKAWVGDRWKKMVVDGTQVIPEGYHHQTGEDLVK